MNNPTPDLSLRNPSMKFQENRTYKLREVLARLSREEIVQNRQLKTLLGTEHYARYLNDCEYQEYLRTILKDKPKEIVEYERRLDPTRGSYLGDGTPNQADRIEIGTWYRDERGCVAVTGILNKLVVAFQATTFAKMRRI
jgi:hypothetical protein